MLYLLCVSSYSQFTQLSHLVLPGGTRPRKLPVSLITGIPSAARDPFRSSLTFTLQIIASKLADSSKSTTSRIVLPPSASLDVAERKMDKQGEKVFLNATVKHEVSYLSFLDRF